MQIVFITECRVQNPFGRVLAPYKGVEGVLAVPTKHLRERDTSVLRRKL